MKELNVGIVGLGWAAGAHIENLKKIEGVAVTAVCSRRKLDETAVSAQYGQPIKVYNDYAAMLADPDISIVSICTPHPHHPDQTVAAAEAGKHLIIEKPVAIAYEDAKRMQDAIAKAGVRTCVCFECRFSKHFQLTRALLDRGLLGSLHYGEVDYYHGIGPWYRLFPWNVKKDFGATSLLTAGCHSLDILLWMMDAPVVEVVCFESRSKSEVMAPYEYAGTSSTLLKFANGAVGKVASSVDCFQPYYFHTHLVGSEGSLLDNRFFSKLLPGMVKEKWSTLETELVDSGEVSEHPYEPQFRAFVEAVRRGEEMPLTDFATAFETHRVAFAADLSAKEGRTVKMEELD